MSDTMYPDEVKEIAYKLDPECWQSYAGKDINLKRRMEYRRIRSFDIAREGYAKMKNAIGAEEYQWLVAELDEIEKRANALSFSLVQSVIKDIKSELIASLRLLK